MTLRVAAIWIHPVKGCRAIRVASAQLDAYGLAGDRRFLIVDAEGHFLTQRSHPSLAQIETQLEPADNRLLLSHERLGCIHVPLTAPPEDSPLRRVKVWQDDQLLAEDCGDAPAAWLSEFLHQPARLVRQGPHFLRPVRRSPADQVSFADGYPLLVVSEASVQALNDRLAERGEEPVGAERFRPNVLISGATAHAEDEWDRFTIGEVAFQAMTRCARCTVITLDPATGSRGPEPLRTLASYRRDPERPQEVVFGRNVINLSKSGSLHVGDPLHVGP